MLPLLLAALLGVVAALTPLVRIDDSRKRSCAAAWGREAGEDAWRLGAMEDGDLHVSTFSITGQGVLWREVDPGCAAAQ